MLQNFKVVSKIVKLVKASSDHTFRARAALVLRRLVLATLQRFQGLGKLIHILKAKTKWIKTVQAGVESASKPSKILLVHC